VVPPDCSYRASRFLDLSTFIDYVKSNNLHFDAISWHELTTNSCEQGFVSSPAVIDTHVARARQLLDNAGLSNMQIHVNEYGPRIYTLNPGWTAGIIAHLESSNVDVANHSCWDVNNDGPSYSSCLSGQWGAADEDAADGLFFRDGWSKRSTYWVHQRYGNMTGTRTSAVSADAQGLSAFATRSGSQHKVLVARHVGCHNSVDPNCPVTLPPAATAAGEVRVKVSTAASTIAVKVERIPDVTGPMTAPTVDFNGTYAVVAGVVTIPLAAIADGDAFAITVG
jgi:hypothetical protein